MVHAISTGPLRLQDEEYAEREATLRWENADRQRIPDPLLDFSDQKFKRDLDPIGLARQIAHEISGSCAECECRY